MRYTKYSPVDVVNGEGTRCTLFVSGCPHGCKGCYNKSTWSPDAGFMFTQCVEDQIIRDLTDELIPLKGLSITGGEPLAPYNIDKVRQLILRVREEAPGKDIWLWTGYKAEEFSTKQLEVALLVDVFIDEPFIEDLKDPELLWRGSSNQHIFHSKDIYNA